MKQTGTRALIGLFAAIIVVLAIALPLAFQGAEHVTASQSDSSSTPNISESQGNDSRQGKTTRDLHDTMLYKAAVNAQDAFEAIRTKMAVVTFAAIDQMCWHNPLSWNIDEAFLVGNQGTAGLWGTCGQCCIANTLNLVTGSAYTEADVVAFTLEQELCAPESGGMAIDDMQDTYYRLLPHDRMGVFHYCGDYAPTINGLATRLEHGFILNVSVYGEMMHEGGHTGEGDIFGTHWIVLHSVDRSPDGSVAGFGIIDSASSITYLSAQELSDIYFGHDGTTIIDPCCILLYGRANTFIVTH